MASYNTAQDSPAGVMTSDGLINFYSVLIPTQSHHNLLFSGCQPTLAIVHLLSKKITFFVGSLFIFDNA